MAGARLGRPERYLARGASRIQRAAAWTVLAVALAVTAVAVVAACGVLFDFWVWANLWLQP